MKATVQERKISALIAPAVEELGFEIVQVRIIGSAKMQTLQIMAENPSTGSLDLNGCTAISRAVSTLLDVEDPIAGAYQLEISSPGVDRPLVREQDFTKHIGFEVSLETNLPNDDGQKRFKGLLKSFKKGIVTLETETGSTEIDYDDLVKAKLVMNDKLIKTAQPKPKTNTKSRKAKSEKK